MAAHAAAESEAKILFLFKTKQVMVGNGYTDQYSEDTAEKLYENVLGGQTGIREKTIKFVLEEDGQESDPEKVKVIFAVVYKTIQRMEELYDEVQNARTAVPIISTVEIAIANTLRPEVEEYDIGAGPQPIVDLTAEAVPEPQLPTPGGPQPVEEIKPPVLYPVLLMLGLIGIVYVLGEAST